MSSDGAATSERPAEDPSTAAAVAEALTLPDGPPPPPAVVAALVARMAR